MIFYNNSSGKWYWELKFTTSGSYGLIDHLQNFRKWGYDCTNLMEIYIIMLQMVTDDDENYQLCDKWRYNRYCFSLDNNKLYFSKNGT